MSKYIDELFTSMRGEVNTEVNKILSNHFNDKIEGIITRYKSIDTIEIDSHKYNNLFMEARELYFQEFYYSCVVMSCSIAEHVLRDLFFNNINTNKNPLSEKTQKYIAFIQPKCKGRSKTAAGIET